MAGDRRDDDAGAIAWPGFVDILSSVLMMFLFFILITTFVMYSLNAQSRKKMEAETQKRIDVAVSAEMKKKIEELLAGKITPEELKASLEEDIHVEPQKDADQALEQQNTALNMEVEELKKVLEQVRGEMTSGTDQRTEIKEDNSLVILYNKNDVNLSDQTIAVIEAYLDQVLQKAGGRPVAFRLITSDNPHAQTLSVSREISLARSLNVRNVLIREKVAPNQVEVEYSKPQEIDSGYNWLKISVAADEN